MNHPYKKFVQLQIFMMFLTLFLGIIALVKSSVFLALITCFTLALSFAFEGIVELKKKNTFHFGQQLLRALIIVIFVCYLYFK
ncbi:hypothetical protein [Aquibacillus rhizosphaerae]|uniref:DUF4181 domain-containing protein n=1 Tax=Aquibacillus rhizosphaerae TaxID=3051431 RepID=A0ABT7L955_9BACI|nr:hypothetical protein [Aquibacillus sp. LR5S19]MDL4841715.1 hypothetical protein [Aquibacillus sp. LR5S19]